MTDWTRSIFRTLLIVCLVGWQSVSAIAQPFELMSRRPDSLGSSNWRYGAQSYQTLGFKVGRSNMPLVVVVACGKGSIDCYGTFYLTNVLRSKGYSVALMNGENDAKEIGLALRYLLAREGAPYDRSKVVVTSDGNVSPLVLTAIEQLSEAERAAIHTVVLLNPEPAVTVSPESKAIPIVLGYSSRSKTLRSHFLAWEVDLKAAGAKVETVQLGLNHGDPEETERRDEKLAKLIKSKLGD